MSDTSVCVCVCARVVAQVMVLREGFALTKLQHPNIVRLLNIYEDGWNMGWVRPFPIFSPSLPPSRPPAHSFQGDGVVRPGAVPRCMTIT